MNAKTTNVEDEGADSERDTRDSDSLTSLGEGDESDDQLTGSETRPSAARGKVGRTFLIIDVH